jgi:hypothetical protein
VHTECPASLGSVANRLTDALNPVSARHHIAGYRRSRAVLVRPWLVGMLLADPTLIAFPAGQRRLRHRLLLLTSSGCYRPFFALLAAQYAFIRFDTSAFCAVDIGFRFWRLLPPLAFDAGAGVAPRLRSGNAL